MAVTPIPLFLPAGGPEILVVFAIVLLIWGPSKLVDVANATGRSLGEFRKGKIESESDLEDAQN